MTVYRVVTSFSPKGYKLYGERFLKTFLQFWPVECCASVFLEGQPKPFYNQRIDWLDLKDDPEHEAFCARYSGREFNHPRDWNMMSVKFGHKVFAITSPRIRRGGDWLIWIDADSIMHSMVDRKRHLEAIFPEKAILTFLGRKGMFRPGQPAYTECGFVGYNVSNCWGDAVLHEMRRVYTSGDLFTLGEHNWHDSYVFDYARKKVGIRPENCHDLSAHCPAGMTDVWPKTILAEFSRHNKGPRRKMAEYGGIV